MLRLDVEDLRVASFATGAPELARVAVGESQDAACWSPLCMDTLQYYCNQTQVAVG